MATVTEALIWGQIALLTTSQPEGICVVIDITTPGSLSGINRRVGIGRPFSVPKLCAPTLTEPTPLAERSRLMAGYRHHSHRLDRRPRTAVDAVRCRGRHFHSGLTPNLRP